MKITIATSFLTFHLLYWDVNAFSIPTKAARITIPSTATITSTTSSNSSSRHASLNQDDIRTKSNNRPARLIQRLGKNILDRSDTLSSAGFYDPSQSRYPPVVAGAKTNITLFLLALGYKWYRSIFINKLAIWERQPQWNTVITSKEDEEKANLEAMTCKNCGSIIFIAKGRKWFQMPKDYTCYCCGATGEDSFINTRDELLDEIDDDYFDYERPLDFVTAAERKKLMKEAGGDEAKANALLTRGREALLEDGGVVENQDGEEGRGGGGGEGKKKKKKKKGKKSKKDTAVDEEISQAKGDDDSTAAKADTKSAVKIGDTKKKDDTPTPKKSTTSKSSTKDDDDDDDLSILGMD
mmetsp:Transcript_9197/g.17319  ORF Transcript_9197/g.17319 Transcript_9197/m.17319 type:complete len:353 (+) Transcript_9197:167-1225(+)